MDVDMGHMNPLVAVDDIHPLVMIIPSYPRIQITDDGKQMRHHLLQIGDGPLLQRFRQNRMVGIGTGLAHHIHRRVGIESPLHKQTDEFRNHHGRMGIVDLNAHMLVQMVKVHTSLLSFCQDELGGIAHHEVLLINAQQLSRFIAVIRIKEERKVLSDIRLVKGDAVPDDPFIHAVQIKQMQLIYPVFIARNIDVIHGGCEGEIFKGNLKMSLRPGEPAFGRDPGILFFPLLVVHKTLQEQAVVIIQSHTVSAQSQRGDGIQETGCKPSEPAVSQGWFQLDLLDGGQILAVFGQHFPGLFKHPQINQIVGKQLSDQEFRRDIIQLPAPFIPLHPFHLPLGEDQQRSIDLFIGSVLNSLSASFQK